VFGEYFTGMKIRDRDPQQQVWREEVEENIKISVLKKIQGSVGGGW
jgi:hypothetical protein